jgi:hypothetical protein
MPIRLSEEDRMTAQPSPVSTNAKGIRRPTHQRSSAAPSPRIVAQRLKPIRKGNPEGWVANYQGFDDTAMWGMGKTEAAAIAQLKEIWPLEVTPAVSKRVPNGPRHWALIALHRLAFGAALAACIGIPCFIAFKDLLR